MLEFKTNADIHHEFILLQLAADRAEDEVFDASHYPGSRRSRRAVAARKELAYIGATVKAFAARHADAIAAHVESFNVN